MVENPIQISSNFYNVPEIKQFIIKNIVTRNINGKLDAYLNKILVKKDAQVRIDYKIQQNRQGKYEAKFLFYTDGSLFAYASKTWFKYVEDLVNHAFDRFKEHLSK